MLSFPVFFASFHYTCQAQAKASLSFSFTPRTARGRLAMATPSAASSFSSASATETRPDAGPLPRKVGEIGYNEDNHGQRPLSPATAEGVTLPQRHPADRDHPPSAPSTNPTLPPTSTEPAADAASTHSASKRSIAAFLSGKKLYGGISLTNLLIFTFQCLVFGGTIGGWVVATQFMAKASNNSSSDDSDDGSSSSSVMSIAGGGAAIFVHVAFAVVVLAQLLFLERRIFHIRVQRYMHIHPGEVLPTSLSRFSPGGRSLPLAPWQRPPIPTYAATLAADGVGTGDVEDAEIARPPPPVYGQTRGSTLLLAGFLRDSLRAQARQHELDRRSHMSTRSDRPVSFVSKDEEWEERRDAERARRVEEALARLENGTGSGADAV